MKLVVELTSQQSKHLMELTTFWSWLNQVTTEAYIYGGQRNDFWLHHQILKEFKTLHDIKRDILTGLFEMDKDETREFIYDFDAEKLTLEFKEFSTKTKDKDEKETK